MSKNIAYREIEEAKLSEQVNEIEQIKTDIELFMSGNGISFLKASRNVIQWEQSTLSEITIEEREGNATIAHIIETKRITVKDVRRGA